VFVLAREVDLHLYRDALRRGNRRLTHLAAVRCAAARGEDCGSERRKRGQHGVFLAGDRARDVMLRNVRNLMRKHRRELGLGLG